MPAVISHYLLSERIYSSVKQSVPELNIDHTAFMWGASGPDLFFLHRAMPWQHGDSLRTVGRVMHRTNAEYIINRFFSYSRKTRNDAAMSYTLGFITHYALDSVCHPYILYLSSKMAERDPSRNESSFHHEIESSLDTIFLKAEQNRCVNSFPLYSATPLDKTTNDAITGIYKDFLKYSAGCLVSDKKLMQVQTDWYKSLKGLNDPYSIKHTLITGGERILGLPPLLSPILRSYHLDLSKDYANLRRGIWYSAIEDKYYNDSFFDLVDRAAVLSFILIGKLLSGTPLVHSDCPLSFSGQPGEPPVANRAL